MPSSLSTLIYESRTTQSHEEHDAVTITLEEEKQK
jgi:hypothetical protein